MANSVFPKFLFSPKVPVTLEEGLANGEGDSGGSAAVWLQSFLGLGAAFGSIAYGLIVLSKSDQCHISRQYLLQSSIFGLGQ